MVQTIVVALITGACSSGVTGFITFLIQRKDSKKTIIKEMKEELEAQKKETESAKKEYKEAIEKIFKAMSLQDKVLRGLAHDRIITLGEQYLARGDITKDEYENLHDYLFVPYKNLGGNGTAEKMMKEVEKLPMKG